MPPVLNKIAWDGREGSLCQTLLRGAAHCATIDALAAAVKADFTSPLSHRGVQSIKRTLISTMQRLQQRGYGIGYCPALRAFWLTEDGETLCQAPEDPDTPPRDADTLAAQVRQSCNAKEITDLPPKLAGIVARAVAGVDAHPAITKRQAQLIEGVARGVVEALAEYFSGGGE